MGTPGVMDLKGCITRALYVVVKTSAPIQAFNVVTVVMGQIGLIALSPSWVQTLPLGLLLSAGYAGN